ncbi:sigma-70 family RNA polymerase sigma factor [Tundrisphaera sp. TA3]|uniref:sigma-70 family RNA polymerase sigma factor n=1 Tax=Tundrisphaera sp. TA3 TaxID=3435775 RepID=UPI003EB98636
MGRGQFGPAVTELAHLVGGHSVVGMSERDLLRRYLDRRDEAAFGAIVERHGPMVLGVCRRILADRRDVEEAFQATFLVLARKGGSLGEKDPVGHWLYGVARRVALRARSAAHRRRARECPGEAPEVAAIDDPPDLELGPVLDEELARLPARYRAPVVLCYFEGLTHDEAARQLGWPIGSVKGRLSRARDLLKTRLARRGYAPAGNLGILAGGAPPVVPPSLLSSTIRAAMAGPASGVVPAGVASLAAGSLATMFLSKSKLAGAILLVLGTGAAVMAYQGMGRGPDASAKRGRPQAGAEDRAPRADVPDWAAGWPSVITPPDDQSPGTRSIQAALQKPINMKFPNETPLSDVLKYIQQVTQDEGAGLPKGIQIYADPIGLQNADVTLDSPVSIDLEDIPLKTTLRLILEQLGLVYQVREGVLSIMSANPDDQVTLLGTLLEKSEKGELSREQYQQLIEMLKLRKEVKQLGLTD